MDLILNVINWSISWHELVSWWTLEMNTLSTAKSQLHLKIIPIRATSSPHCIVQRISTTKPIFFYSECSRGYCKATWLPRPNQASSRTDGLLSIQLMNARRELHGWLTILTWPPWSKIHPNHQYVLFGSNRDALQKRRTELKQIHTDRHQPPDWWSDHQLHGPCWDYPPLVPVLNRTEIKN